MGKHKIALTIRSLSMDDAEFKKYQKACKFVFINKSNRRLSETELISALTDADGVIAGTEQFNARVIDSAKNLMVISRVGIGMDSIDVEAANRRGIQIQTTPIAPVQAVAEHTLALILCLLKQVPLYNEAIRREEPTVKPGSLLSGKTVGIVGLGKIGFRVAEMLSGLGCRIVFFDPFLSGHPAPESWCRVSLFEELLSHSDIITLHTSGQKGNSPIFDEKSFMKCKKGVIIINTARGSLIDENALIHALDSGIVAAAGLDVFFKEPYNGPLLSFSQVVATPHVASNTLESRREMEREAFENLIGSLEGIKG